MHKILRVLALIIGAVIAIYLMITLFVVFLALAVIGLVFFLYAKYFGKAAGFKTKSSSQGVTIEYAEYQSDLDENSNESSSNEHGPDKLNKTDGKPNSKAESRPPIEHDK